MMPCITNARRERAAAMAKEKLELGAEVYDKVYLAYANVARYLEEFKATKEPMSYDLLDGLFGGVKGEEVVAVIAHVRAEKALKSKGRKK